jgi:hypothetical protein
VYDLQPDGVLAGLTLEALETNEAGAEPLHLGFGVQVEAGGYHEVVNIW